MGHLLLVRHGQASFGADDYDVLSERGWEQGRLLGSWLRQIGITPTAVIHGSMRRHRESAEAMMETAKWTDFVVAGGPGVGRVRPRRPGRRPPRPAGGGRRRQRGHAAVDRRRFQEIFEEVTARWTAGEQAGALESYADFLLRVRASLERAMAVCGKR